MNHVISLINNANLTPFEFMKRVAKGEVQLVIESNIGEQLTPPKEFWQKVIKRNSDNIPTILQHHVVAPWSWESKALTVHPTAIDVLRKTSPNDWVRIREFLSKDSDKSPYYLLKVRDLFSNWHAEASKSLEVLEIENEQLQKQLEQANARITELEANQVQVIPQNHQIATQQPYPCLQPIADIIEAFKHNPDFVKYGQGVQQQIIENWLRVDHKQTVHEARHIKALITAHYNITT
jgi:hypothetical protein